MSGEPITPPADDRPVCEWCDTPARGEAWHNDGRLHPSCGQVDHGHGWVPSAAAHADLLDRLATAERAVRMVRSVCMDTDGDYLDGDAEIPVGEVLRMLAEAGVVLDGGDQ